MMIGYKVVRKYGVVNGEYRYTPVTFRHTFFYQTGKSIKRPNDWGPLAVFKDLKSARKFIDDCFIDPSNYAIFKCRYAPSKDRELWYRDEFTGDFISTPHVPLGTVFANSLTLLEKVK